MDVPALDRLLAEEPVIRQLVLVNGRGGLRYPRGAAREAPADVSAARARRSVEARDAGALVATFALDVEALRRDILPASLGPLGSGTILAVFDAAGRTVYAPAPLEGAQPLQSVAFRERLPNWRLTVYQPSGAAPRAAVRRQIMRATMISLVIGDFTRSFCHSSNRILTGTSYSAARSGTRSVRVSAVTATVRVEGEGIVNG